MLKFSPFCLKRLNLDKKLSQILENVESVYLTKITRVHNDANILC